MLIFSLDELPEQKKGKGVILQRYKDGLLSDIKVVTIRGKGYFMENARVVGKE